MSTKFGWCAAPDGARPDHEHCPGQIGGPDGLTCSCLCHLSDAWWPACPDYSPGASFSPDAARSIPKEN